ncbi:hypothetical protein DFJ58DRAFT_730317 [Suillus subalutaceus]|uniref:uncharacterized protein n=1 Tax=Suillus subalutaceus TaxID=48586 RepID=UPI001B87CD57|nr:uncharacterized protein DFJ58DRAFT_730317 [Suillus subalutaceus]KAG1846988.1 hypothetical protein DFJ58DRAFT_730317 [Suillus subalutaceus]
MALTRCDEAHDKRENMNVLTHINIRYDGLSLISTIMYRQPGPDPNSRFDAPTLDWPLEPVSRTNRNFLPTPPRSNRTSLEESQGPPEPSRAIQTLAPVVSPTKVDIPPGHLTPPTSPSSPGQETPDSILKSLKNVANRVVSSVVLENVSAPMYEAVVAEATKNGDWQDVRVDYNGSLLIVHCPSLGHEFPGDLFDLMGRTGRSYPRKYHSSRITQGGSTTIDLVVGSKSPDFSLYEVKEGSGLDQKGGNVMPTVALEVGYYGEKERKLTLDAGRLICLSKGMIQLVATIDIDHEVEKKNNGKRKLKSVIWTHWEMDPEYPKLVEEHERYELNELIPETDGELLKNKETVQPIPDAYRAVVTFAGTSHWVRAYKSNVYKLFPPTGINSIPILYRHLFRDPQEGDQENPAFTIQTADIMATIHSFEEVQREIDGTKKRKPEDVDLIDNELLARFKRRRAN